MRTYRSYLIVLLSLVLLAMAAAPAGAQYKMTTPFAPGVAVPDKIESSIGTLNLNYGYPSADTVEKIYDNLDRSRALQAYLLAIPIVNQAGMRDSIRKFGPDNQTDVIWEDLVDPRTVELTANDNTIYNFIWVDTSKGPVVVEIPPKVLGRSTTSGTSGWPTSASPAPTRARAASTSCCRPDTRATSRRAITSCGQHLRQLARLSRLPCGRFTRRPAWSRSRRTCGSIPWPTPPIRRR